MSTIGNPGDNFSPPVPEDKESLAASPDERISALVKNSLEAPTSSSSLKPLKELASLDMPSDAKELAAKTERAAAGAGIAPPDSSATTTTTPISLGPVLTSTRRYGRIRYEVPYVRGKDLGADVCGGVRILAMKDIPLPLPFDDTAFEAAKKRMGDVLADPLEKRVFQKVTGALLHITLNDLLTGLGAIIPRFNKAIEGTPFTAVIMESKSNEWVTQFALNGGIKPPSELCVLEHTDTCETPARYETIAIIDDGSYSGDQISSIMTTICRISRFTGSPAKKFFIIVPFITTKAQKTILNEALENKVEVEIMSFGTMPTFDEVLTAEEAECFKRLAFFQSACQGPTLSFTDWRRPDAMSAPTVFLGGEMLYTTEKGIPRIYSGPPLVPDIQGPYKLSPDYRLSST